MPRPPFRKPKIVRSFGQTILKKLSFSNSRWQSRHYSVFLDTQVTTQEYFPFRIYQFLDSGNPEKNYLSVSNNAMEKKALNHSPSTLLG